MVGSLSTIKSFHVSTQDCSFLTRLPPIGSPPATMNWYQSDLDCFDTTHQFHSLGFHRKSIILAHYRARVSFPIRRETFIHSAFHWPRKERQREESRRELCSSYQRMATFPPLGHNPERWNVTEPSMQSSRSRVQAS